MFTLAVVALVASVVFAWGSVLAFAWSARGARALLTFALAASGAGALAGAAGGRGVLAAAAFVFGWAACGCNLNAARQLDAQPPRWIHRFAIYAGYGATFAAMALVSLGVGSSPTTGWRTSAVLAATWMLGSAVTFVAKTLTVALASKSRPEYVASLSADPHGRHGAGYW